MATLLDRVDFDAAALHDQHPPRLHHASKLALFLAMGGAERRPKGTLTASRWAPGSTLAYSLERATVVEGVLGPFDYPAPAADVVSWHVNFADPELFAFYGGTAFAQDEIQVAEHPSLACLREALKAGEGFAASTYDSGPTPVLVRNVERWGAIDTGPTHVNPDGIYGRKLARASDDAIRAAVRRLDVAHTSHVIAMAAPQGSGVYRSDELSEILTTAITGFAAARLETQLIAPTARLRVSTGHWGTGAFGGDRVVMAALQIVAANFVGVDELRYHSLDAGAARAFEEGKHLAESLAAGTSFDGVVQDLESREFSWGRSDGN